jgi:hypothetical protein
VANRHKQFADGGVIHAKKGVQPTYQGKGSNVEKEAMERKAGGRAQLRNTGGRVATRLDKR